MTTEIRLNLGCGLHAPSGWINVDRSPNLLLDRLPLVKTALRRARILSEEHMVAWPRNIRQLDVTKPLPFVDNSVAAIYSSHMLEHLYHDQALALLRECRRVLRPTGIIRLALPDAHEIARRLLHAPAELAVAASVDFTKSLYMSPMVRPTRRQRLLSRFASGPHRWQPTAALVTNMLSQTGYQNARSCSYLSGDLPGLAEVEHRAESLFVEAEA